MRLSTLLDIVSCVVSRRLCIGTRENLITRGFEVKASPRTGGLEKNSDFEFCDNYMLVSLIVNIVYLL